MLLPTDDNWRNWGIVAELHRVFVLHWHEMFDSQTPDTWQPRTVNFRRLLQEIVSSIDVCREYPDYKHNLPVLLEEAQSVAAIDPILSAHFPLARGLLPTDYVKFVAQEPQAHLSELRRRAQAMIGHLEGYCTILIDRLRALLRLGSARDKHELYYMTVALATEWSVQGYSLYHLSEGFQTLIDSQVPWFSDRFDEFVKRCDGQEKKFRCRLSLVIPQLITFDALASPDIAFVTERPADPLGDAENEFYGKPTEGEVFADVTTAALDPLVARRNAEEQVARFFGALNIFMPDRHPDLRGKTALIWRVDGEGAIGTPPLIVPLRRTRHIGLQPVADVARQAAIYLDLRKTLDREDADQIDSALQYHRLALQSSSEEARLVNLWIGLETLCRRDRGPLNIINSVCEQVAPSVAGGNLRKLLTSLATYLNAFRRRFNVDVAEVFPNATQDSIPIEDLLDMLLEPEGAPRLTRFTEMLAKNPLLRYRVYKAWKLLSDRKKVRGAFDLHKKNVDWQLRRIYRARNDVMHRGRGSVTLPRLILHLHTYLGLTLHNLMFDLTAHPKWSVPDAFKHRQIIYSSVLALLDSRDGVPKHVCLDASLVLAPPREPLLWKPIEEPGSIETGTGKVPASAVMTQQKKK